MRPRFMNRGSGGWIASGPGAIRRFNEAPIHESGKFHFGSVAIFTYFRASMRPRFMNRGSNARDLAL